jgi:lysozyme
MTPISRTLRTAVVSGLLAAVAATGAALPTAQAAYADNPERPAAAAAAAPLTYGQDVSNHQPDHDWTASPAGFGIVKATEGTSFKDRSFARHWKALDAKGIVRGAYHFAHPGNDPVAEAEHFLSVVNSQPAEEGDLLVLDLEVTDGQSPSEVNAFAKKWLSHVEKKTGTKPFIYSGRNFADENLKGLSKYPLWVAHYGIEKGSVTPPADWKTWTIHQYSDSPIDQNVSSLTADQLRELGRPAA